jgi:NAD(P)-dependent dehydrogenase (short-subunit alcohol dehydrogenase family)
MKAVRLLEYGGQLVFNDVSTPAIAPDEIAVLPGLTNTVAIAPQSGEQKRAAWEQQAIKRLGEPEDVTGAVLFLTSDDAAFITGQAIVVGPRINWSAGQGHAGLPAFVFCRKRG